MLGTIIIFSALFISLFTGTFFLLTFLDNLDKMHNPAIKKFPTVTIIIPAHKEEKGIAGTIESALGINYPKDKLEIIVVENGCSGDRTVEIANRYKKKGVKVYSLKKGGKGYAMNYVIKRVKSDIVISMDADSFAEPDVLYKMMGYFNDPKVMAVAPTIKSKSQKTLAQRIQNVEYLLGGFARKVFQFIDSIYVTPGAFTAYRKKFFDNFGAYDEGHITEDLEIALRINSKGYKLADALDASVYTITPRSFKELYWQRIRWFLGFIDAFIQYRSMLFGFKYGYLSALVIPTATISVFFTIYLAFLMLKESALMVYWFFLDGSLIGIDNVNFGFLTDLVKLAPFSFNVSTLGFAGFSIIFMGLLTFYLAKKYSLDKSDYKFGYLVYIFLYIVIFATWWVGSIWYKFFGRELRFGGLVWNNSVLNKYRYKLFPQN